MSDQKQTSPSTTVKLFINCLLSLFHSLPCSQTFLHTLRPADTDTLLPDTWHTAAGEQWLRVCVCVCVYLDAAVYCGGDVDIAVVRMQLDHVVLITSRWWQPVEWESTRWHAYHSQPLRTGRDWNTQILVFQYKNIQMHAYSITYRQTFAKNLIQFSTVFDCKQANDTQYKQWK